MLNTKSRAMKKVVYILSDQINHHIFFSNLIKHEYEICFLEPKEVELKDFRHYLMDLIIINENSINTSLYSLLRILRNTQDLSKTPIIVITSRLKQNHQKKLKRAGATAVLLDPLNQDEAKKALSEGVAFHNVVEKTSNIHTPSLIVNEDQILTNQSVVNVTMLETIEKLFHEKGPLSLIMAKIVLLKCDKLSEQMILEIQKTIAMSLNTKTLTFLSDTEFFFSTNLDSSATKTICHKIKDDLSSKQFGVCFGIATNNDGSKDDNIKDYLFLAKQSLDQALKHPNTIVAK